MLVPISVISGPAAGGTPEPDGFDGRGARRGHDREEGTR
jgi:hypothetical protein